VIYFRGCRGRAGNWERDKAQTGAQSQLRITARPWWHSRAMTKGAWEGDREPEVETDRAKS